LHGKGSVEQVLQHFEQAVRDASGASYRVYVYGQRSADRTWHGWLVFERLTDGRRFSTGVETSQPTSMAVVHWANGLEEVDFAEALLRARRPVLGETVSQPAGSQRNSGRGPGW
jgi:hypothetical protein